ncbi:MAG: hypothetical protein PHQ40_05950 [Anaerolineaceae bacterium]|nr:hypothetical protein [Anaerolineaceae bacterium]
MLTERDLRELLVTTAEAPVLSVYLSTDPAEGNADTYRLRLRNMLKEVDLPQDIQAVEHYFDLEHAWTGRSVAIFSCAPQGFFRAYPLAVPVTDWVHVDTRPAVKPLVNLLDAYGGYGVVLVDKQGARLFYFHLGELREQEGVVGELVKHTKRGGASAVPGRRGGVAGQTHYEDELVERNMRETVDFALHFFEENHIRRVLIGGTDDNIALFRGLLPKAWQSLVVGAFPMSMTSSQADILEKAMQVGSTTEQHQETHAVDALITAAAKGDHGAIGLDDTLSALHEGRVQTLIMLNGYQAPGYRCGNCGFMTTQASEVCPFCASSFETIPDVVELAVRLVMQAGGDIQVIRSAPRLEQAGNIGALLRY